MSMYYIKTGLEYWKPKGYGYTKSREEAGVFTLKDMYVIWYYLLYDGVS